MPYKKALSKNIYKEVHQYHLDSTYKPEKGNLLPARHLLPNVDSVLLTAQQAEWIGQHIKQISGKQYQLKLWYRGSQDGLNQDNFHRLCDNKGATLTVIHPAGNQQLLGGYTALDWDTTGGWKTTNKVFLFSFNSETIDGAIYSPVYGLVNGMYCGSEFGPYFGAGNDLVIGGWNENNFTNANSCGCNQGSYIRSITTLNRFHIDEMEVFQVLKA